ncbi:hypothetical protein CXB51_026294 [Gossypium anomalum]|uniref:Retrotransposon Copia-like N-terminal domain-containing protein n=1 Tax=Gossypium anomalum TaxID=47600 RepID=A0A8J5YLN5_9ROSI|nr:hypothetical protein CXB51_026294 [Gossypium anomalum]
MVLEVNPFAFASQKVATLIDDSNFLPWKQHFLLVVKTHCFQHYLDGIVVVPPLTVADDDGSLVENPTFVQYEQQDAAISAWLLSIVSPSLHNRLIGDSSFASMLWSVLNRIFGSQSITKAKRYRSLLHNYRKNDMSMSNFLAGIKHLCDCLAGCGQKVFQEEQQSAILNGVPPEYDHVVSIITTSQTPFDLQRIATALLDAEAC